MPHSHPDSVAFAEALIADHVEGIATVVDVGAGAGTLGKMARRLFPDARIIGVEMWAPYIKEFDLNAIYDEVIVADVVWLNWYALDIDPTKTLVLFGDVLEHLPRSLAELVLKDARSRSDNVVASLPIIEYPQGPVNGNPYETHLTQWTDTQVKAAFPGFTESIIGPVVGTYLWN